MTPLQQQCKDGAAKLLGLAEWFKGFGNNPAASEGCASIADLLEQIAGAEIVFLLRDRKGYSFKLGPGDWNVVPKLKPDSEFVEYATALVFKEPQG